MSLVLGAPVTDAWSQTSNRKAEQKAEKLNLDELKQDLASRQEARVVGALNIVREAPQQGKELGPDVEKLLANGSTLKISLNALRTLAALEQESSSKVVAPYVRHRTSSVRHTAANTLLKTKGPDAVKALRGALRAPDKEVRDIAAKGLGSLGAKEALDDLFQALDHRVFAAAVSIGQLCAADECLKFLAELGKLQLEVVTSGTDQILFRQDIDEKTKLAIVERIKALRTLPATEYLTDVYKRWPKEASKSLKKAIGDAVEDNGGELEEAEEKK